MTTTTADATKLAGHALYIEAQRLIPAGRPSKFVMQMLFTPEAKTPAGVTIAAAMYRRRITDTHPRATWKHMSSASNAHKSAENHRLLVTSAREDAMINDIMGFATTTLDQVVKYYEIVAQPIAVEVSVADLDDIRLGKTPYKVFGRVWKTRKKLGFPAEFI